MVRSSQKRFLSFPVMGAMDIVCFGVGEDDSDGGEGKVGMRNGERGAREGTGSGRGPNTRQQGGGAIVLAGCASWLQSPLSLDRLRHGANIRLRVSYVPAQLVSFLLPHHPSQLPPRTCASPPPYHLSPHTSPCIPHSTRSWIRTRLAQVDGGLRNASVTRER